MEWSSEVGAADWIVSRLHPFATDVGSLVPDGFAGYVRILHPIMWTVGIEKTKMRWAVAAARSGIEMRPTIRIEDLQLTDGLEEPTPGTMACDELAILLDILAGHTTTPGSCWFCVWDGYGWIHGGSAMVELTPNDAAPPAPPADGATSAPRVRFPHRNMLLYRGPIEAAARFCREPVWQSPNLWWPEDRSWCVATEIDLHSTYVGGSQALVDEVRREERLETQPSMPTDTL